MGFTFCILVCKETGMSSEVQIWMEICHHLLDV